MRSEYTGMLCYLERHMNVKTEDKMCVEETGLCNISIVYCYCGQLCQPNTDKII